MASQQRLGLRNAVFAQGGAGCEQLRIARGGLEEARARRLGPCIVANRHEVIGEGSPRIWQIGVELHAAAKCRHRFLTASERTERQSQLVVSGGPARLARGQRLEHGERHRGIAARAPGDAQDQSCAGVPRGDFENLARLFGGEGRIALEKAPCVGERCVD